MLFCVLQPAMYYRPFLLLSIVCLARLLSASCPMNPGITGCSCSQLSNGILFSCNSVSVRSAVGEIQAADIVGEVDRLNFLLAPDVTLSTNTFLGFDSLRQLRIQGGPLSSIEPGAFNSLPQLISLDLRFNNLEWLSEEMFTGIGTLLENLHVDMNQVRHLRSNLQPFFSSISDSISLGDNILMCDCHLQWLVEFLNSSSATVTGTVCSGSSVPITDPSISFNDCQDVCSLQFHNCHENATCQPNVIDFCVCDPGFVGDGSLSCDHICDTNYSRCHVNATCQLDANLEVVCTCHSGFMGDGHACTMVDECELECPGDNMHCVSGAVQYCSCDAGSVLLEDVCMQNYTGVKCPADSMANYQWPATVVGMTAYAPCSDRDGVLMGNVSRDCTTGGMWGMLTASPTCVSPALQDLWRKAFTLQTDRSTDPELVMFTAELLDAATAITFAGDIPLIVELLHFSVDVLANTTSRSIPPSDESVVQIGSRLLEGKNIPLWQQLTDSQVSNTLVDLFAAIDELGEAVFQRSNTSHVFTSNNIALVVLRPNCTRSGVVESEDIVISSQLLATPAGGSESKLLLPPTLFSDALGGGTYDCSDVGIVAVVYSGAGPLYSLNGSSLLPECDQLLEVTEPPLAHGRCEWYAVQTLCPMVRVNSVIISAVVVSSNQMVNTSMLSEPIVITLQHEDVNLVRPMCSFLNEQEVQLQGDGTWLTEGCVAVEDASTRNTTVCQCFHLTSFALLMSPTGPPPPNLPLQIVSKIGLCISIICLIISITLLFGLKLDGKLHHIHRQLALALCLSQIVFLVGVDRTLVPSPDGLCTAIAAILHYLLLCTFAWQLIEGIHLYLFIVKVFFNERIVWAYYPLGWGAPLLVVAITLGVRFCDYGSQNYCWITTGNGTNWAFHGPVIAVLLVNIVIMVIVTSVILRAARKREQETCLLCTLFHASLVLLPILGITWLLGFFVVGDSLYSEIVEWFFCIFTALQGVMIFVMHCILNRDVRAAFLKRIGCREAAKQQSTVMTMSRRLSHSSSTSSFRSIFKKAFTRTRTLKCEDITSFQSFQTDDGSGTFSGSFTVARPNSSYVLSNYNHELHDIAEEGESAASTSTPELKASLSQCPPPMEPNSSALQDSSSVSILLPVEPDSLPPAHLNCHNHTLPH